MSPFVAYYNVGFLVTLSVMLAPVVVLAHKLGVRGSDVIINAWIYALVSALKMFGLQTCKLLYDPNILSMQRNVIVCNHVNYFDWLIVWAALVRLKKRNVVFCAKRINHPIMGYILNSAMFVMDFILVDQNINEDNVTLVHEATALSKRAEYNLVIFPEGRLLCTGLSKTSSHHAYDKDYSDSLQKCLLPPKTKGFDIIMKTLGSSCDGIIDCTLHYTDKLGQCRVGEAGMSRRLPEHVRVYMKKVMLVKHGNGDYDNDIVYENWLKSWFIHKATNISDLRQGFDIVADENRRNVDIKPNSVTNFVLRTAPTVVTVGAVIALSLRCVDYVGFRRRRMNRVL